MPLYEYKCDECRIIFEEFTKVIPDKLKRWIKCKSCGKRAPKIISSGVKGRVTGGTPKFHGIDRAGFEHKWMENEIKNTKDALKFDKGVSPYSRMNIDSDYFYKKGMATKKTEEEQKLSNRVNKEFVETAQKKIDKDKKK